MNPMPLQHQTGATRSGTSERSRVGVGIPSVYTISVWYDRGGQAEVKTRTPFVRSAAVTCLLIHGEGDARHDRVHRRVVVSGREREMTDGRSAVGMEFVTRWIEA